jgi:N-acetyl-anhydromuramyl-L-alanine amidase AmpD
MKTKILSKIRASSKGLLAKSLAMLALSAGITSQASTDYGPAGWYPDCNYTTSGNGKKFYVIHDMEGYFASSMVYLSKCTTQASIHYLVNGKKDTSTDYDAGRVYQSVRDAYYAWHALCWNHYSMGTEHEGFASNPAWYT